MEILVLLGIFIFIATLQVWRTAPWQPGVLWFRLGFKISDSKLEPLWWKTLARWKWWSTPGWWVKTVSPSGLNQKLNLAGLELNEKDFLGLKQWLWSWFMLLGLLYLWFGDITWSRSLQGLLCGGLLFMLPDLWLQATTARRWRQLSDEVPYFLDLLTLTLQSGSNLEQALAYTCQNYQGVLSEILSNHLIELNWGRSLDDIFTDLQISIPDPEFQHFLSSILRAKKLGVSLGETLAIQSELLRTRRRQQAEELSRTAAVKISVPLVLFVFPALLIIYIGPGVLQLMNRA